MNFWRLSLWQDRVAAAQVAAAVFAVEAVASAAVAAEASAVAALAEDRDLRIITIIMDGGGAGDGAVRTDITVAADALAAL